MKQSESKPKTKWSQLLLGFVLLIIIVAGLVFISIGLWNIFKGLQKEVAAALIAASTTILVSVFSITGAKYYDRRRSIEQELREKKMPVYFEFIEFNMKLLFSDKITGKAMSEKEMEKFLYAFTQKIMIWGSDEVVVAWSNYRRKIINYSPESDIGFTAMFELERLLLALRKDTGHKNKNIKRGDLLGLFINDVDNYV
jgi:hypothetical protein